MSDRTLLSIPTPLPGPGRPRAARRPARCQTRRQVITQLSSQVSPRSALKDCSHTALTSVIWCQRKRTRTSDPSTRSVPSPSNRDPSSDQRPRTGVRGVETYGGAGEALARERHLVDAHRPLVEGERAGGGLTGVPVVAAAAQRPAQAAVGHRPVADQEVEAAGALDQPVWLARGRQHEVLDRKTRVRECGDH